MDKITSFQTLIGSLYKKYNKASVYGKLDLKTLYILNLVNKLLYDCPSCNSIDVTNKLICLATKLKYADKEICNYSIDDRYYINNLDIFNNIVLNNSPIKVINTPPVIDDPEESDPELIEPPTMCEYEKSIIIPITFSKHNFDKIEIGACIYDSNDPLNSQVKNMKIVSLPLYNPLTYQGINVTIGQVIDVSTLNDTTNLLLYSSNITQNVNDSFTYRLSALSNPTIYTDNIITMNVVNGNPI